MTKISEQSKSAHSIVIDGMPLVFDRYSETNILDWEDYNFLHCIISRVHEKTLAEAKKDTDIG